jgi:hypothetical protein
MDGLGFSDIDFWLAAAFWLVVQRSDGRIGMFRPTLLRAAAFWLVGERSEERNGMFRLCFVVSSCLMADRSADRSANWDDQTVVCGERLFWLVGQLSNGLIVIFRYCLGLSICFFVGRSAVGYGGLECSDSVCGEQLPFDWSASGPKGGFRCSESVFW